MVGPGHRWSDEGYRQNHHDDRVAEGGVEGPRERDESGENRERDGC